MVSFLNRLIQLLSPTSSHPHSRHRKHKQKVRPVRMAEQNLTVKLRNTYVHPSTTRTFVLPKSPAIATSLYLRAHTQHADRRESVHGSSPVPDNASSPPKQKHDGIIRLNFPDFEIFAIYVDWLNSGKIHTKDWIRGHRAAGDRNQAAAQQRLRRAFTDYLGAYFLGCWLQDSVFRDSLISLIVSSINSPTDVNAPSPSSRLCWQLDVERAAQCFLAALKPSLVDLVLTDEKASLHLRRLIYAAIAKWAGPEHMGAWVPADGRTCERGFVRGLLGWLVVAAREKGNDRNWVPGQEKRKEQERTKADKEQDRWASASSAPRPAPEFGTTTSAQCPPGWAPPMQEMWTPQSHVSWSDTGASGSSGVVRKGLSEDGGAGKRGSLASSVSEEMYAEWPEREEDVCGFHEHGRWQGCRKMGDWIEG